MLAPRNRAPPPYYTPTPISPSDETTALLLSLDPAPSLFAKAGAWRSWGTPIGSHEALQQDSTPNPRVGALELSVGDYVKVKWSTKVYDATIEELVIDKGHYTVKFEAGGQLGMNVKPSQIVSVHGNDGRDQYDYAPASSVVTTTPPGSTPAGTKDSWVQCDDAACGKWWRMQGDAKDVLDHVKGAWFCGMATSERGWVGDGDGCDRGATCEACFQVFDGPRYDLVHACSDRRICAGTSYGGAPCLLPTPHGTLSFCRDHRKQGGEWHPGDEDEDLFMEDIEVASDEFYFSACPVCAGVSSSGAQCTMYSPFSLKFCSKHSKLEGKPRPSDPKRQAMPLGKIKRVLIQEEEEEPVVDETCKGCMKIMGGETSFNPNHTCSNRCICNGFYNNNNPCKDQTPLPTLKFCMNHRKQGNEIHPCDEAQRELQKPSSKRALDDDSVVGVCSVCRRFMSGGTVRLSARHTCSDRPICVGLTGAGARRCSDLTPRPSLDYCEWHHAQGGELHPMDRPKKIQARSSVKGEGCSGCCVVMSGEEYDSSKLKHTCTDRPVCKGHSQAGTKCTNRTPHRTIEYCKKHSNQVLQEAESMNIDESQSDKATIETNRHFTCIMQSRFARKQL